MRISNLSDKPKYVIYERDPAIEEHVEMIPPGTTVDVFSASCVIYSLEEAANLDNSLHLDREIGSDTNGQSATELIKLINSKKKEKRNMLLRRIAAVGGILGGIKFLQIGIAQMEASMVDSSLLGLLGSAACFYVSLVLLTPDRITSEGEAE